MKIYSATHSFIAAMAFAFAFGGQVYALTVYDVIKLSSKGYSNQDIITLIEVTDSTFALKAEDIPNLGDLGVSETVIQAMLKAKHFETLSDSPTDSGQDESIIPTITGNKDAANSITKPTNPAQDESITPVITGNKDAANSITKPTNPPQNESITPVITGNNTTDRVAKPTGNAPAYFKSNKTVARKGFKAKPFAEADAGGHRHSVITLSGIQLFVLRDEGLYPSIVARGNAVENRLQEATSFGNGTFQPVHIAGKDAVMFFERRGAHAVVIVSVSEDDAYTYQRRSGRRVTPELLSAYWSALLSDYWSIAIADKSPAMLTGIHEGEALQALYDRLTTSGSNDRSKLKGILESLPQQQQEHLLRLSTGVPHEFMPFHSTPLVEHP
jgi:hypothetical protein